MSQETIAKIIKEREKIIEWVSFEEIKEQSQLSKNSIMRALRILCKRDEIQFKIIQTKVKPFCFKKYYRTKKIGGEND